MKLEAGGLMSVEGEFGRKVTAVFKQFDACQRRTEPDLEGGPMAGFPEGDAHPPGCVAQETNHRHAGEQPGLPQDQVRVQMPNDGLLNLTEPGMNSRLAPEKRQRGGIVTEEQNALFRSQRRECSPNFRQVLRP